MTRSFKSYDDYKRHLKNKYGQGEGANYKPWFTVRDVKGPKAFRKAVKGLKTGRTHHLLSALEAQLYYILEFRSDVIDIREQFPLIPIELSQKIANTIGVEHPKVKASQVPFVMTTDILVTVSGEDGPSYIAFCVKPQEELDDLRVQEKIDIERIWWELLGVPFQIFTGNDDSEILSQNISWVTDPLRSNTQHETLKLLEPALSIISTGKHLKADICDKFKDAFDVDSITALNILRTLIAQKLISVDLTIQLESSPIIIIEGISLEARKVVSGD